jgi:DNA-binding CsgD family transcriptional regulator
MERMDGRSDRSHRVGGADGEPPTVHPAGSDGRSRRLSDAERAEAVRRLAGHQAAGRLTADEVRDRTSSVRAARTRADLARVFADLPDDHPLRTAWRDRFWRTHAALFAVVTTAMLVVWAAVRDPDPLPRDYGADYWWPVWVALLWGTVVLLHLVGAAGLLRRSAAPHAAEPLPPPPVPEPADPSPPAEEPVPGALSVLTPREIEVLTLIGQGHANKDIAAALFISERTARTHVSNILQKLELSSRTQAAILAVRSGLRP